MQYRWKIRRLRGYTTQPGLQSLKPEQTITIELPTSDKIGTRNLSKPSFPTVGRNDRTRLTSVNSTPSKWYSNWRWPFSNEARTITFNSPWKKETIRAQWSMAQAPNKISQGWTSDGWLLRKHWWKAHSDWVGEPRAKAESVVASSRRPIIASGGDTGWSMLLTSRLPLQVDSFYI